MRENLDAPASFNFFFQGLHLAGLKMHAVRRLTPDQMDCIVAALNSGDLSMFGAKDSAKIVPMTVSENEILALATDAELANQNGRIPVLEVSPVFNNAEPPAINDGDWPGPGVPTPAFFDGLNVTGMGLRWQFRDALKTEGSTVIGMPWPAVDRWSELVKVDQIIFEDMETTDYDLAGISRLLRAHIGLIVRKGEDDIPMNWLKAWLWILIGRHTSSAEMTTFLGMTPEKYFVGTTVAMRLMGGGSCRELVTIAA